MPAGAGRYIEIFTEAVQLSAEERVAFLDRSCAGDEKLRQKIEALLKSNDRAGQFLEQPPATLDRGNAREIVVGEKPGDVVGKYKLLQQIGEGGCGIVFMAEQLEPVRRRVALKVIKPGMDTKSVIARFEAERQALAMMDHPGIARVLDAGATDSGRPYFVMELVKGVKISDFCDEHSVPIRFRLELFIQVCDAIQHAHQRGIIHRDIKPSNILVTTLPDGKPLAKVIDFGIAKATTGLRLTDKTIFTSFEMLIGTPAYMSPEQAALTSADVDTRTDIYSLGVLLYELLTGTTPFDTQELLKAGIDEIRRVIRDQVPARPSTRLSTMGGADTVSFSNHHATEVPKLIREMRGDLDWIVMKALEKEPTRRYATANGLAMDVARYLAGEGVLARPPTASYRLRKLVGRNRLVFSGVTLIFVLLLVSLIATTRWLIVERRTRDQMRQQVEFARLDGLGWERMFQGKFTEAEQSFRDALTLRKRIPGAEQPSTLFYCTIVVLFDQQKRLDKVAPFFREFLNPALVSELESQQVLEFGVNTLVSHKLWNDADILAEVYCNIEPTNSQAYHMRAPLLVAKNDVEGYRHLCSNIVSHFSDATNCYVADRMAKDCLILPSSGVDLHVVANLADVAVSRGTNLGAAPFFRCSKALAEFRLGNFEEAAKWAHLAVEGPLPYAKAEAAAVAAMSEYNLNRKEEARLMLAECNTVIEQKLPKPEQDPGGDWRDWIFAHALQSEAKKLLDREVSPVPQPVLSQ